MFEKKVEISKYNNAFGTENLKVILSDELDSIANGQYKTSILDCRQLLKCGNKPAYNNLKKRLPALTFSGTFTDAHKKENLLQYSRLIVIDIDNLNYDNVESEKRRLFNDKYVFAAWISPSGLGIKLLIRITSEAEDHALCFLCLSEYLKTNYKIEVDKSGSDVCRLCFVSYDPRILRKNESAIFDFNKFLNLIEFFPNSNKKEPKKISEGEKREPKARISTITQKALFHATEGKNKGRDRETIEKIIKYLRKSNQSITTTYHDWFRVALAVANSFTYDLGQRYYLELCELDNENYDEYKSKYMLDYCYANRKLDKITFSTIVYLATQKGFKLI
jgi:hypothetical protein